MLLPKNGFLLFERTLDVYKTLIAASSEAELLVSQVLNERTVYQHIDVFQHLRLCRHANHLFKQIACVAPDGFSAPLFNGAGQFGKSFRLHHGVSACERDVCERVSQDGGENLFHAHALSGSDVPRLRIVATLATVGTACGISRSADARPVNHCFFDYSENGKHVCVPFRS